MVEQAKHAQANAEQKFKAANQTVNLQFDFFCLRHYLWIFY